MTGIRAKVTAAFDKIAAKYPEAVQTGAIQQPTPITGGGPSDTSGGTAGAQPDPIPARVAVFEVGLDRIDGTNIKAGDFQVIVEPPAEEITVNDMVICDRGTLAIEALGREASGGETFLYDMVCRG